MRIRTGKKKRVAAVLLTAALIFGVAVPLAPDVSAEGLDLPVPAAVLMEFSTGEVLYEKSAHAQRPCASITKVMTLLLVFEAIDSGALHMDDMLTASAHAAGMGGSDIWLKEGEQMSVDDLIKACVVMSANDAAVALAEAVAGTEEAFVERMNARAAELGMADTTFKNCNGLDEDGHLTSAYDVAVMSRALMAHEKIFDYTTIWIDYVRDGETQLVNTNKLVRTYNGIKGLKTGTTSAAGSCISAAAERNGMTLIGVVLGADNTNDRFSAAASLLDYGFANWKITAPELPELPQMAVSGGMRDMVRLEAAAPAGVLTAVSGETAPQAVVELPERIDAPVQAGQQVGKIRIVYGEETVQEVPITAAEDVQAITFRSALEYLLSWFFSARAPGAAV